MKSVWLIIVLIIGLPVAQAQDDDDRYANAAENISYGYADVLRVDPVYEFIVTREPHEECDESPTQAAGAVVGGSIGHSIEKIDGSANKRDARQNCRIVEVEHEERHIVAYDVEYRYRGEVFLSRLNNDPGEHLRVRVTITPVE